MCHLHSQQGEDEYEEKEEEEKGEDGGDGVHESHHQVPQRRPVPGIPHSAEGVRINMRIMRFKVRIDMRTVQLESFFAINGRNEHLVPQHKKATIIGSTVLG